MAGMASQRALKSLVRALLPLRAQLWLRRFVLARRTVRESTGFESELAGVRRFLRLGDVALDLGANAGAFAIAMARTVGPGGKVLAFEPIPENLDVLRDAVRLASLSNVEAVPMGVSDRSGRAEFVIPDAEAFAGYYLARIATPDDRGSRGEVPLESLDALVESGRLPPPAFIKCDVEGHELAVLRGAVMLMQRHYPNWYIEVTRPTSEEVFAFLLSRGYSGAAWKCGEFLCTNAYLDGQFRNYFFFHPDNPRTATAGIPGYPAA
jgi:FkbM family methyltransferase